MIEDCHANELSCEVDELEATRAKVLTGKGRRLVETQIKMLLRAGYGTPRKLP